ncbi:MAG TPA: hypothetical protein VGM45_05510 [Gaiellaceae bacterium]|jgi:hypothetical protein
MTGLAARLTTTSALAGLALAVAASSGAAASPTRAPILGVVPHTVGRPAVAPHSLSKAIGAAGPAQLTFDPSYETLIDRYFADVADDSGGANNVYSVMTQYYDTGPVHIQYASTVGGSFVDRDPLPASACSDNVDTYCLTDEQLQHEIQVVLTAKGWQGGLDHIFFLMTPNGVGSCFNGVSGQCSSDDFCAYHSVFQDSSGGDVIYANEPYEGPSTGCADASQGFPNNADADTTINTISHEHNESITDPLGTGWLANDTNQDEVADLCAFGFGTAAGGTPGIDAYNQTIHGHHYDLQEEYSNADGGCVQRIGGTSSPPPPHDGSGPLVYRGGPVMHTNTTYAIYWLPTARNTTLPAVTGTAAVHRTLTTSAGSWAGGATTESDQWQRCSSTGKNCVDISGATVATYRLTTADGGHVVRSTVRATNVNGTSTPAASRTTHRVVDVPAARKAPHISGRARVGKKLSGSHGSWTFSPTGYRYQWLRCNSHGGTCSGIRHATHSTYKLTSHDAAHRLRLRVTATNAAGKRVAVSAASAPVGR